MDIIPAQLGGEDVLGRLGIDIPPVAVGVVIVVPIQRYRLGTDLVGLHHQPDRLRQFIQELVAGIPGTPLQLQHDVLLIAVDGGVEVATGVDRIDQLADDNGAGLPLVAGVGGQDGSAVVIEGIQGHHIARLIVVHLDFRVDAQQHGADTAVGGFLCHRGGIAGIIGRVRRSGAVSTGGQSSQGQRGSQGKPEPFGSEVLFHFVHLKSIVIFVLCG